MPKLTARRLIRTLRESKNSGRPPLNVEKWRAQLRDIRNTLIKLRDKAEDELDRVGWEVNRDFDNLSSKEQDKLSELEAHMERCVDYIADSINQIDLCL